jgi:hypothetical protein
MNNADFQLRGDADPRLALHAASPLPAWLWSADGTRIVWTNAVGARVFGAPDAAALAAKTFGPADQHRRQLAQLAGRLLPTGATRLERLRGFGAALGALATCACSRLDFADGGAGILVVAMLNPGELQRISAPERIAPAHREEHPPLRQAAGAPHSISPASGGRAIARIARSCGDRADASAGCRGDGPIDTRLRRSSDHRRGAR